MKVDHIGDINCNVDATPPDCSAQKLLDICETYQYSQLIKVPITEFFLFSYLNLYITQRTSAKKFFDLHETRIFYEFCKS